MPPVTTLPPSVGGNNNAAIEVYATVGGGIGNTASGGGATVGGGGINSASGYAATVGGGYGNTASGYAATVGGGNYNTAAGDYSFVVGRRAKNSDTAHDGVFIFADSTDADFASTGSNQFLVRANGGVGINTNAPANASLQVAKDFDGSGTYGQIEATGATNNAKRLTLGYDTTNNLGWVQASETSVAYRDLALDPNGGDVLIGTTTDTGDKLRVNGTIRVDALGVAGSTHLCINGSNQIANCSSSLRYKSNVANLNLGLDTVAQLRPVTFAWKDTGEPDLGFVAEEVNQITPLLTTRNADGQIEGVKYDRISAVLVNAVQEQQQQIAGLKAENADLEARITALEQAMGKSPTTDLWNNGWVFGALLVAAVVIGSRRWGGTR